MEYLYIQTYFFQLQETTAQSHISRFTRSELNIAFTSPLSGSKLIALIAKVENLTSPEINLPHQLD